MLADFGSTFYAPPAPPFFGQENEAHLWGIPLTIKVKILFNFTVF